MIISQSVDLIEKFPPSMKVFFLLGNVYTCGGFVGKKEMIESTSNIKNKNYKNRNDATEKMFSLLLFPSMHGRLSI